MFCYQSSSHPHQVILISHTLWIRCPFSFLFHGYIFFHISIHILYIFYNRHGPLAKYIKSRVAHAPGMPVTFSPQPRISGTHNGTCVMHIPWCMLGSLTSSFLWSQWWEKRSRHSQRMRNPQFYVSGKRPMGHWQAAKGEMYTYFLIITLYHNFMYILTYHVWFHML